MKSTTGPLNFVSGQGFERSLTALDNARATACEGIEDDNEVKAADTGSP